MWEKVKGDVDVVSVTQQLKHLPAFGGNSIASAEAKKFNISQDSFWGTKTQLQDVQNGGREER